MAFADGYLELADDEAWLLSDATTETTAAAGFGEPIDSRQYGPVPLELLVGRAWFRYAPLRRVGLHPARRLTARQPSGLSRGAGQPTAADRRTPILEAPRGADHGSRARLRPDRPAARTDRTMGYAPTPSLRPGPPFHMTDMIAAEPALAGRILARLADAERRRGAAGCRDQDDHRGG